MQEVAIRAVACVVGDVTFDSPAAAWGSGDSACASACHAAQCIPGFSSIASAARTRPSSAGTGAIARRPAADWKGARPRCGRSSSGSAGIRLAALPGIRVVDPKNISARG